MTGQTPPFDPFWMKPLTSDDKVVRRLAKKLPKLEPRSPPGQEPTKPAKQDDAGLTCPSCACPLTIVIATRKSILGKVWRRRECHHCGHRFSTFERAVKEPAKGTKNVPIDISVNQVRKIYRKRC